MKGKVVIDVEGTWVAAGPLALQSMFDSGAKKVCCPQVISADYWPVNGMNDV